MRRAEMISAGAGGARRLYLCLAQVEVSAACVDGCDYV